MRRTAYGTPTGIRRSSILGRVTFEPVPIEIRANHVLVRDRLEPADDVDGYAAILFRQPFVGETSPRDFAAVSGVGAVDHLGSGDVVAVYPTGHVRSLYRQGSRHNVLFATDNCNSYCLMCSQPPRETDDGDRLREHLRLLDLIEPGPSELGVSGGEPTLFKDGFLELVSHCADRLPTTALHVLSNGRLFRYQSFARRLGQIRHPDLMVGVPLYSDHDYLHDFVVQSRGAFDDTVLGLQNLGRYDVPVEIRVVIHRETQSRLGELAEFIYRNLTFASQVVFMGLEITGFTVPNLEALWIDPADYQESLRDAVFFLAARGVSVSIYNHQLCTLQRDLWPYCRKSISDWKNEYLPVCDGCAVRHSCGGFFASGVRRRFSAHIQPIPESQARPVG